ncbi:MAG: sterol desaturase family protein [Gammaproteobacteria bacterium]
MELLIMYAIPVFIALIALEWFAGKTRDEPLFDLKDTAACLAMGTGNVVIHALIGAAILALYFLCYEYRILELEPFALSTWFWLFVAEDFCYYWFHRAHHEIRIGWAGHVTHHSSTRYNLAVALRQSWTTGFTGCVFWIPLALVGFHPLMIVTQQAVSLLYQFWIHTQTINRLGPLELVLNTPSHHRVHHGSNPQYIDRNYGGILIIWDRVFGTFEPEKEPVVYGLTNNLNSYNPLRIAFHEWESMLRDVVSAKSVKHKLFVLVRHPKWFSQKGNDAR